MRKINFLFILSSFLNQTLQLKANFIFIVYTFFDLASMNMRKKDLKVMSGICFGFEKDFDILEVHVGGEEVVGIDLAIDGEQQCAVFEVTRS